MRGGIPILQTTEATLSSLTSSQCDPCHSTPEHGMSGAQTCVGNASKLFNGLAWSGVLVRDREDPKPGETNHPNQLMCKATSFQRSSLYEHCVLKDLGPKDLIKGGFHATGSMRTTLEARTNMGRLRRRLLFYATPRAMDRSRKNIPKAILARHVAEALQAWMPIWAVSRPSSSTIQTVIPVRLSFLCQRKKAT